MGAETPLRPHHLRPAPGAHKSKVRKGRGEASKGKTAGRGTKGTKARNKVPVPGKVQTEKEPSCQKRYS